MGVIPTGIADVSVRKIVAAIFAVLFTERRHITLRAARFARCRVSGLKIGYKKGVFMGLGPGYDKGDWLVRFDTLQPALQAGLTPTVVVDR